jgi:hypothetical protein
VRVLLGLGDVQLRPSLGRHDLRERAARVLGPERDGVLPALLVARERRQPPDGCGAAAPGPARKLGLCAGPLAEARLGERAHELAHAVGAEVEAQHAVGRGVDAGLRADERRLDELVGLAALVGVAHGLLAALGAVRRPPVDEQLVRAPRAVPAAVAVHRPVAPDDRPDAGPLGGVELGQEGGAGVRQRVAAVGERVHDDVLRAELARERDQRAQVRERGVHAAVGDEPDQVHAAGPGHRGP